MAKKCPPCECPAGVAPWLGTYGDMVTLLLTFFILLLSMATFDKQRIAQAIGSLDGSLAVLEKGTFTQINPPMPIRATPIETEVEMENVVNIFGSLITDYNEINRLADGPSVDFEESQKGIIIRIPDSLLFEKGSAEISNKSGLAFLRRLAVEFEKLPKEVLIKAIGHTDNTPLSADSMYLDLLDLSIARGVSVAEILAQNGANKSRISGGGEGQYSPLMSNEFESGRARNRRVELYVYSVGDDLSAVMEAISK